MSRIEKSGARLARNRLVSTSTPLYPGSWVGAAKFAPLALRLIVGFGFMEHGYAKLARGPDNFTQIVHALGMPLPELLAWATILVELVGGAAILLGAFVALASIPMAFVLLTAIFTVHLPNGFSSIKLQAITASGAQFGQPGYETDLLYLACLIALVLGGAGPWSVDGAIKQRPADVYP
jgi:putative oxidoreductase